MPEGGSRPINIILLGALNRLIGGLGATSALTHTYLQKGAGHFTTVRVFDNSDDQHRLDGCGEDSRLTFPVHVEHQV